MMTSALRFTSLMLVLVLVAACGVLARPDPVTTLVLPIADLPDAPAWPGTITAGRVTPAAALNTPTVLASSGALLMQYEGLRWAAPPAQLLQEQLGRLAAASVDPAAPAVTPNATLRIVLSNVEWRVDTNEALWRAHGIVACVAGPSLNTGEFTHTQASTGRDAAAVATAFQLAGKDLITDLLREAARVSTQCDTPAPEPSR